MSSDEKYVPNNFVEIKYDLHMAVESLSIEYILAFLSEPGVNIAAVDRHGDTVLHSALKNKFNGISMQAKIIKVLKILIDKGIDINARNCRSETVLHLAAEKMMKDVVQNLIIWGADLNACDGQGNTLAYYFVNKIFQRKMINANESLNFWEFLCRMGMDIYRTNGNGDNAISIAAKNNFITKLITCFNEIKNVGSMKSRNKKSQNEDTLLHKLLNYYVTNRNTKEYYSCWDCFDQLIKKGVDVNKKNHAGLSPLQLVFQHGGASLIELLVEHGADITVLKDNNHLHELCMVSDHSSEYKLELLVRAGCDINTVDSKGWTPLHITVYYGRNNMFDILMSAGANVNARNTLNYTPLLYACRYNRDEMVVSLLKAGAHRLLEIIDSDGLKPLDHAIRYRNGYMVEELLSYGARIDDYSVFCKVARLIGLNSNVHETYIKLLAAEMPVGVKRKFYIGQQFYQDIYLKCLKEVAELKSYKINRRTSLYDFLHMDWNSRCIFIDNKTLVDLTSYPFVSTEQVGSKLRLQFPIYNELILTSYNDTVERRSLLEPAKYAWYDLTDIHLPDVCVLRILAHLPNDDLKVMIDGSKNCDVFRESKRLPVTVFNAHLPNDDLKVVIDGQKNCAVSRESKRPPVTLFKYDVKKIKF